jgi:hypothetical protein
MSQNKYSVRSEVFALRDSANVLPTMLRKLLWTGLYAGISAGAAIAARRAASRLWRLATGEQPPTKK